MFGGTVALSNVVPLTYLALHPQRSFARAGVAGSFCVTCFVIDEQHGGISWLRRALPATVADTSNDQSLLTER